MAKNLLIVESPAKAKTLKKFLGNNYHIEASMGHVRDLPKSALGIDVENDFEPKYITIRGKGDVLKRLRKEVKAAEMVYLATDPDREGEAISWHLFHALDLGDKPNARITFNEITKNAVKNSIKEARVIDMDLVDAQQTRRALDRLVGYMISPLLWKKVKKGLSAGRVQSVLMKIICDREEEINSFIPREYWTIEAELLSASGKRFTARLTGAKDEKLELADGEEAMRIAEELRAAAFKVAEIKRGTRVKKPYPPFTTSTLQQEASKYLNMSASKTMSLAQQLYEGVEVKGQGNLGLISYIRTDSVRVSDEAFAAAMDHIDQNYGSEYANHQRAEYKSGNRSQDAHEAIRPSYVNLTPYLVKDSLSREQQKLYTMIWERFVASQMTDAVYDTITVKISAGEYVLRASGSVLKFPGFKLVYKRDEDEKTEAQALGTLKEGETLTAADILPEQHFTQPPPRFTEAMLVKTLEENGVGRPSTYAPTISTVIARGYATKEAKVFFPTELGSIVNGIMENNFADIVNIAFTSGMEDELDQVEDGKVGWKDVIRKFYPAFKQEVLEAEKNIGEVEIKDQETDVICENCGRNMVIKMGRFGKFLACPGFPECRNTLPLLEEAGVKCPKCGGKILIKKTKKGRRYYNCENPDCGLISWNKPTGALCPQCGGPLVEKGKFAACQTAGCGYKEAIKD